MSCRLELKGKAAKQLREQIYQRSGGNCDYCGTGVGEVWDLHHRQLRSQQGDDTFANCIVTHHVCHMEIHAHPGKNYLAGFLVKSHENPEIKPLHLWHREWVGAMPGFDKWVKWNRPKVELYFAVKGTPIPQGSKRLVGGVKVHARMIEANPKLKPWREQVAVKARSAVCNNDIIYDAGVLPVFPAGTPVAVDLTFWFEHPKSHYNDAHTKATKAWRSYPTSRRCGDLDKLTRAIFDALTDAQVWADDSQAVRLTATKIYESAAAVGVAVRVTELDNE